MLTDEQIHRINELARKSKEHGGLTEEEKAEQHTLRAMYVAAVKRSLQGHLEHIRPLGDQAPDPDQPKFPMK